MPTVQVRLFAGPREAVGARVVRVEVPSDGATVEAVVQRLLDEHPVLRAWRASALVSVNRAFAEPGRLVRPGDEVAFMPPVSGGSDARGNARIRDGPLSVDDALGSLSREGAGAAVAFLGIVRATSGEAPGKRVERLEFDAYPEMAEPELARVLAEARGKFGLVDASVRHRVGSLETGEDIVLVVVTAAHRREAFEAAAWIMDALKSRVPVWKKEIGPEGEAWVNDGKDAS